MEGQITCFPKLSKEGYRNTDIYSNSGEEESNTGNGRCAAKCGRIFKHLQIETAVRERPGLRGGGKSSNVASL